MFHKLSMLHEFETKWKIKIRVTRMWESISSDDNSLIGYNCIFLDAENYHMHAFISAHDWNTFANILIEGNLYEVHNFITTEAKWKHRPVSSRICIKFKSSTVLQPILENDCKIPFHKFELVDLRDVKKQAESYRSGDVANILTDIVGVVEDLQPAELLHSKFGDQKIVRFKITDGRNSIRVTFWGNHVNSLNPLFTDKCEQPPIVILASIRPLCLYGEVVIGTVEPSRIYINLDYDDVNNLRTRLQDEGYWS